LMAVGNNIIKRIIGIMVLDKFKILFLIIDNFLLIF